MDQRTASHLDQVAAARTAVRRAALPDADSPASGFVDALVFDQVLSPLVSTARAIVEYVLSAAQRAGASDANLQFAFPLGKLWARAGLTPEEVLSRSLITVQAFARTVETQAARGDQEKAARLRAISRQLRIAAAGTDDVAESLAESVAESITDDDLGPWYPHLREGDRWGDVLGYQATVSAARAQVVWREVASLAAVLGSAALVLPEPAPSVPPTPLLPTPTTALQEYDDLDLSAAWRVDLDRSTAKTAGDTVDVWFGTTRAVRAGTQSEFGPERSPELLLGRCHVFVPRAHRRGSSGSSLWQKIVRLDFRDDTLKLQKTTLLGDRFEGEVNARLAEIGSTRALLFVHGYNSPFEGVIVTAAQLAVDLDIDGIVAAFSWPSRASEVEYFPDLAQAESAWEQFVEFIERLKASGVEQLDIVVHSMGNRVLSWAMERLAGASASVGHLYLAAADLDPDILRQRSRFYRAVCGSITSYSSTADKALGLSRFLHGVDRVGLLPPVTRMEGMTTIDVSAVDDSFIGHGYFASASPVLDDIGADLDGVAPGEARRLDAVAGTGLPYWKLRRGRR